MNHSLSPFGIVSSVLLLVTTAPASAVETPLVEKYLLEGRLADGEKELARRLEVASADDQARFGLGTLQFLQSIETLSQSLHRYGALGSESRLGRRIPFLRLAIPRNAKPETVGYADVRAILERLLDNLATAEATLAKVTDGNVSLPLRFGLIRLDLNGDRKASDDETLWRLYAGLNQGLRGQGEIRAAAAEAFVIRFDYADVCWLRGYCHLLSSMCEIALAYDQQPLFDAVASYLFDRPVAPPAPDAFQNKTSDFSHEIADAIAAIHLCRLPLKEPQRMKSAREHLQSVMELSRASWKSIQAETDDDHEWIPNSRQTGVIPGVRVTAEMIAGWHEFLDEAEALLAGRKLLPHWRFQPGYGINLRRIYEEPRDFDLVLWAHGAAALPYTERGETTKNETWRRLQQLFGGQFIGFAFWFN